MEIDPFLIGQKKIKLMGLRYSIVTKNHPSSPFRDEIHLLLIRHAKRGKKKEKHYKGL